jgi:hypothetical protein
MDKRAATLCFIAVSLVLSCRTSPIPEPEVIPIPDGLNKQNVEIAILSAFAVKLPPPGYDPRVLQPPEDFEQLVWRHYVASSGRAWLIESREPGEDRRRDLQNALPAPRSDPLQRPICSCCSRELDRFGPIG